MKKLGLLSWVGILLVGLMIGSVIDGAINGTLGSSSFVSLLFWLLVLYFFVKHDIKKYERKQGVHSSGKEQDKKES